MASEERVEEAAAVEEVVGADAAAGVVVVGKLAQGCKQITDTLSRYLKGRDETNSPRTRYMRKGMTVSEFHDGRN